MAGDWIKMKMDLPEDPDVIQMCDILDFDEYQVTGRLHKLWSWADKHTNDGVTKGITKNWVDRYVCASGFANAMIEVGWLMLSEDVLIFPNFDVHNGQSAKKRCDDVLRKRMSRERHKNVTNGGDKRVAIPRPFVRQVLDRDQYTCVYCGEQSNKEREASRKAILSIDHIVPYSRGNGRQALEDLATCCRRCNSEKTDRTPEEWGLLPTFLATNCEYSKGTIVTKFCDNSVTREEKRREEKNIHSHPQAEEFAKEWTRWCEFRYSVDGRQIPEVQAESILMELHRRGPEKAKRDIDFSIQKGARSILDSDNDFGKQRSKPKTVDLGI